MKELTRLQPLLVVSGTTAASGDTTLIAAPGAGRQIVVSGIQVQNESAVSTTVIVKFGATAAIRSILPAAGNGFIRDPEPAFEVGNNNALVLNLSGGNSHNYSIAYWVDSV